MKKSGCNLRSQSGKMSDVSPSEFSTSKPGACTNPAALSTETHVNTALSTELSADVGNTSDVSSVTKHDSCKNPAAVSADVSMISDLLKTFKQEMLSAITTTNVNIASVDSKVDALNTNFQNLRGEVKGLSGRIVEVEGATSFNAASIHEIKSTLIPEMKATHEKAVLELRAENLRLEMHSRKRNLLIHGIQVVRDEYCEEVVRHMFINKVKIQKAHVDKMIFIAAHRLSRSSATATPPPIIVSFVRLEDKDLIMRNVRNLKASGVSISTDLPAILKQQRSRLAKIAFTMRNSGINFRIKVKYVRVFLEVFDVTKNCWCENVV